MSSALKDGLGNPLNIGDNVICLDYGFAPFRVNNFKYFKGMVVDFTPTMAVVEYFRPNQPPSRTKMLPNVLIRVQSIQ